MMALIWMAVGFAMGVMPFSLWLGRILARADVRHFGDGNPGAANAWLAGGWRVGGIVLLLDYAKGAVFDYETKSSYDICVRTDDGSGGTYDEAITIQVTDANDAPAASDDTYSVGEDTTLGVAAPGVLNNDSDEDAHPLTAVLDSGPGYGTLTLNGDGSFVYAPPLGYKGVVTFTYHAHDGAANSNTATVSVTVGLVNEVYLPLVLRGQPQTPGADLVKDGKPTEPYPAHPDGDDSPDLPLLEGILQHMVQRAGRVWPLSATICPLPWPTRSTRPRQLRRSTFAQPPRVPRTGPVV